jgi:putative transcriptional regulator
VNQPFPEQLWPAEKSTRHIEQLTSGSVLLAREVLQDPNFEATVVLVCVHGEEGTYGLVLNRISHMPVSEIFEGVSSADRSREILIGGPVRQTELQIIEITEQPAEGAYQIVPGIYMGGKWDDISAMIDSPASSTRLFLGYSGWGPGQLTSEIQIGAWDVYSVDIRQLIVNCHLLAGADTTAIASFLQSISSNSIS